MPRRLVTDDLRARAFELRDRYGLGTSIIAIRLQLSERHVRRILNAPKDDNAPTHAVVDEGGCRDASGSASSEPL